MSAGDAAGLLEALVDGLAWRLEAACRGSDPEMFFTARGEHDRRHEAQAICQPCPVRIECLEYAIDAAEPHGVWGGLTALERKNLRAKRGLTRRRGRGAA